MNLDLEVIPLAESMTDNISESKETPMLNLRDMCRINKYVK